MEIRVQMPDLDDFEMDEIEDEEKRKERKGTSASIVDAEDILKKAAGKTENGRRHRLPIKIGSIKTRITTTLSS